MDPQHYLDRIGHQGRVDVSLGCLARLQLHHQTAVPFENLDNFTGRRKVLQEEALYHQVSEDMSPMENQGIKLSCNLLTHHLFGPKIV